VLLHDCGKGRSRDHSIVGAELFGVYAKKIGLTQEEIKLGRELILYHTKMSVVAQREDLHSEQTILKFASIFSTQERLDLIYLLTYSDMRAVGGRVYNDLPKNFLLQSYIRIWAFGWANKCEEGWEKVWRWKELTKRRGSKEEGRKSLRFKVPGLDFQILLNLKTFLSRRGRNFPFFPISPFRNLGLNFIQGLFPSQEGNGLLSAELA